MNDWIPQQNNVIISSLETCRKFTVIKNEYGIKFFKRNKQNESESFYEQSLICIGKSKYLIQDDLLFEKNENEINLYKLKGEYFIPLN